jgi:apolipoprotein D and lipocalin family protein
MISDFLTAIANSLGRRTSAGPPPVTVPAVDLGRYLGRWYEVARLPNPEEDGGGRHCVDVTATYSKRPDGTVDVVNAARDGGSGRRLRVIRARARALDRTNAKLRVTFFHLFGGNYWVLGLDPEYRWALVGTPSRRRLWLLSRTPALDPDEYDRILSIAATQGYDPAQVRPTPQSDAGAGMDSPAIQG